MPRRSRRSRRARARRTRSYIALALTGLVAFGSVQSCQTSAPAREASVEPAAGSPDEIRVRLLRQTESVALDGPTSAHVAPGPSARGEMLPTPLDLRLRADGFVVKDARGKEHVFDRSRPLRISPVGPRRLTVAGAPYPGQLELVPQPGVSAGVFDVVEHVKIEEYLPGVVTKELFRNWSPACFEAQAIAARSYAVQERARQRALGTHFDLEASEADQAYAGAATNPLAVEAVRKTTGMTLTWESRPLRTYYSSTCGGRAGSAKDTWPTGPGFEFNLAAPIQASERTCPCESSPLYRWKVTRNTDELVKRFALFGRDQGMAIRTITSLSKIEPIAFNPVGRPTRHKVYDASGRWWEVSAEQLRLACNYSAGGAMPSVTRETRVSSGDIEVVVAGATTTISGRGFGHGVGMCQYGAEGLARQGKSAEQILGHYYPGAQITRSP